MQVFEFLRTSYFYFSDCISPQLPSEN